MDVWRYSDWYGRRSANDVWNSAPQIWRWRKRAQPSTLRGPQLLQLSVEQIWDSHLVLLAKDIDERKSTFQLGGVLDPQRLRKLTAMTADEIIAQAHLDRVEHTRHRELACVSPRSKLNAPLRRRAVTRRKCSDSRRRIPKNTRPSSAT